MSDARQRDKPSARRWVLSCATRPALRQVAHGPQRGDPTGSSAPRSRTMRDVAKAGSTQGRRRRPSSRRAPPRGVWLNAPDHQCLMRRAGRTGAEDAMGMSTCERRAGGFTRSRFCSTSCGRATTSSGCVRCNQAKPEGVRVDRPLATFERHLFWPGVPGISFDGHAAVLYGTAAAPRLNLGVRPRTRTARCDNAPLHSR